MISISGEHTCRVDAKGRFLLPAGLKAQLADVITDGFIIKKSIFNQCLELYPQSTWDELDARVKSKLNRFVKKHNDFYRALNSGLKKLELDGMGRVLIPHDLIPFAGISSDIIVSAKMDCIEIWDKLKYEANVLATQENMSELAEELLGDINLNE